MTQTRLSWLKLTTETIADCKVFSVHKHISRNISRRGERISDFYVLEPNDWVNVIPITPEGNVVLVEQYRHGIEGITLEIPGGTLDHNDNSPLQAAARELLEETGYVSPLELIELGSVHPNPAIQSNLCHTFLARDVYKLQEPQFDTDEELEVRLVPLSEMDALIAAGRIRSALVIVAFHFLRAKQRLSN